MPLEKLPCGGLPDFGRLAERLTGAGTRMDVSPMVARLAGAGLGLFAFTVTVIAGLAVGNPVGVTLSRSILALLVFCLIGLVLGTAVQHVLDEHRRRRLEQLEEEAARAAETSEHGEEETTSKKP